MPKVKIYTTATCVYCRAEKGWLQQKGVEFEEVAVDQDQQALEEMVGLSGQFGVPFTVITQDNGKREGILGFDQARLTSALGLS